MITLFYRKSARGNCTLLMQPEPKVAAYQEGAELLCVSFSLPTYAFLGQQRFFNPFATGHNLTNYNNTQKKMRTWRQQADVKTSDSCSPLRAACSP